MPDKAVHLLVVEGFADWEPAHAVAELRRHGHYHVESVGLTMAPVRSMGGITVLPSRTVADMDPAHVAVFILPGGDRWERSPIEPELEAALRRVDRQSVPIAASCSTNSTCSVQATALSGPGCSGPRSLDDALLPMTTFAPYLFLTNVAAGV